MDNNISLGRGNVVKRNRRRIDTIATIKFKFNNVKYCWCPGSIPRSLDWDYMDQFCRKCGFKRESTCNRFLTESLEFRSKECFEFSFISDGIRDPYRGG